MIECILFDKELNQLDLIPFTDAKFTKHIYDPGQFSLITGTKVNEGYFITLVENRKPIFSGVITRITEKDNNQQAEGYDMRKLLEGIQYAYLYNKDMASKTIINTTNTALTLELIQKVFSNYSILYSNEITAKAYKSEIRIKSVAQVLRECSLNTDIYYNFYPVGNQKIYLEVKALRDLRSTTPMLVDITHNEVQKIIDIKEKYNQILGLGSGEDENRDYHFINNRTGSEFSNCYIYDIRENISHEELIQRTETKYKELQFDYQITFKAIENKLAVFGVDYGLGDYVSFRSRDGITFDDLITQYVTEIKSGVMVKNYELTTGLLKGNLTDKIKELKEGGYS